MTLGELLAAVAANGIRLEPRLRYEGPAGALTPELLEEFAAHKPEILLHLVENLVQASRLRDLYRAACFELAETLGWPRLQIAPHLTIVGGEALWRMFLRRGNVPELRERVLPRLREMANAIPPPNQEVLE